MLHLRGFGTLEPVDQLAFAKSPLTTDLHGRDLFALGPQAEGSGRDTEPFRHRRGAEERFTDRGLFHRAVFVGGMPSLFCNSVAPV